MPLAGQNVKLVLPESTLVESISPTGTTESVKKIGIGGLTRTKFLRYTLSVDMSGSVTSYEWLGALLGTDTFDIQVHDVLMEDALASDLSLSITPEDVLTFDATIIPKKISTTTPGTPTIPGELFAKAEALIALNKAPAEFESIEISASRDVTPVYAGTGTITERMMPSDLRVGAWEYSADVTLAPETISDALKLWDPTSTKWVLSILFIDSINPAHTCGIALTGLLVSESSPDISAEEVTTTWTLEGEALYVGPVSTESFTGDGSATQFTLSGSPIAASIIVTVNEVIVSNWSLSSGKIVFTSAPNDGASIKVNYIPAS